MYPARVSEESTRDPGRLGRLRIYTAAFCVDAIGYGYSLLVPVRAQEAFEAGPLRLGILGTVSMLTYALICAKSGRLSDRLGSQRLFLLGLGLLGLVGLPLTFMATNLVTLFVASIVAHAGLGLFWPPLERQLFVLSPKSRLARTAGTFNCTWAAGICLGTIGGASLYGRLGYDWGLGLLGAFAVLALIVLLPRFGRATPIPGTSAESLPAERLPSQEVIKVFLLIGWTANFAAYFASRGIEYLFTHMRDERGYTVEYMGWFLLSIHLTRLVAFFVLRRSTRWHYSLRFLFGVQVAAAASLITLSFLEEPVWFFVLLPVLGFFVGLSYFSSFYYGFQITSKEGENSGNHELFLALGMTFGPLVCGLAAHWAPGWPEIILAVSGGALILALVVESRMASRLPAA